MAYVLRKRTNEDKEYFIKCGVKSPFGGTPSFGRYIVENLENDTKMALLGGQGIMSEDGIEWSETASYCAVVWKGKKFIVEYYSYDKCIIKNKEYETIYKLKKIYSSEYDDVKKEQIMEIVKNCFIAYGNGGARTYVCKEVKFIDTEVRWA